MSNEVQYPVLVQTIAQSIPEVVLPIVFDETDQNKQVKRDRADVLYQRGLSDIWQEDEVDRVLGGLGDTGQFPFRRKMGVRPPSCLQNIYQIWDDEWGNTNLLFKELFLRIYGFRATKSLCRSS